MIISRGRSYVFVHIPKTGGTSMALALEARAMKDDLLIGDTPKAQRRRGRLKDLAPAGRLWKHSTLADIDGVVSLGELDRLTIVATVRNPWARVVSLYHWLRRQDFGHPAVARARALAFGEFARHPATLEALRRNPSGRYVTDAAGRERETVWIRLENLGQDLAPFEAHLGFRLELPHANPSDRPADWRALYDRETAAAIGAAAAADIARFGYRFD